jgi:hypothetical protein
MLQHLVTRLSLVDESLFEFDSIQLPAVSTAGTRYWRKVPYGMPRIPSIALDSVFYLYPTVEDAKRGREFGGTGFFFGMPAGAGRWLIYAVTNWHVAVRDGCSVIRVNLKGGGTDIIELDPGQWFFKPRWHDLAIIPFPIVSEKHLVQFFTTDIIASPQVIAERDIGPGEDVFMIGRFIDYDGGETNVPALRFGNISVMPQPIMESTGAELPNYVLDMHSRTGYSGSPVFAYRTRGADLSEAGIQIGGLKSKFLYLLGIHRAQFPEKWEIEADAKPSPHSSRLAANEKYISGMSEP